jgi:hypothetical protein
VLSLVFASPDDAPEAGLDRQVVVGDPVGVPVVFGWRSGRDHWLLLPDAARFRFRAGSSVVKAYPTAKAAREDVIDAYHGSVLPIAVQIVLSGQSLHASAVAAPDGRIVAFCGSSLAGKTTIAFGLSRRGCPLWADDVVAFETRSEGLTTLRLPFKPNLREQSASYFGSQDRGPADNGHAPDWSRAKLGGVCVLERLAESQEDPVVERLSARDALIALLAHSFRFKPQKDEEKRRMMQDYLEVVAQLPVFRLRYSAGFDTLPAVIDEVEEMVLRSVPGRRS